MRIAIVSDTFPPMRTSGAVQLQDLAIEFSRQGHSPMMFVLTSEISEPLILENVSGVEVLRLKVPRTKDIGYVRRTFSELFGPYLARATLKNSSVSTIKWDGVVWYSPSIFLSPLVRSLKQKSRCRSYLVLRDIFPEWAVDMGLMRRGLPYRFFKAIERAQYVVADVIGVQTPANLSYFRNFSSSAGRRIEVLQNWLAEASVASCSISVASTRLAGRKIFVYAGNMGIAQGMDILLDLVERLRDNNKIGFLFVGRGSDAQRLRGEVAKRDLDNALFFDEIDPTEIPGLYAQCHVGLIALDSRHKTHNIPGKFLSYMQAGLPVLASINPGNDLKELIEGQRVGRVCVDNSVESLAAMTLALISEIEGDDGFHDRCRKLSLEMFSPEVAVRQIVDALRH